VQYLSRDMTKQYTSCFAFVQRSARISPRYYFSPTNNIRWCRENACRSIRTKHTQQSSADISLEPVRTHTKLSKENDVQHDVYHWFTQLLPEGWCIGVCTSNIADSTNLNGEEKTTLNATKWLHSDEYHWGKNNIASDASRTSYYLGRTALRISLNTLLESEVDASKGDSANFYTQLNEQIQNTAIRKDYYGRPILPEIILGSISHKGEYAVGISQFHSSTWDGSLRVFDNGLEAMDASEVSWREECPILENDDMKLDIRDGPDCSTGPPSIRGVGIDLEQINDKRGGRIGRKVLTENELEELGGLEVSA